MKLKRSYIGSVGGLTPGAYYWSSSQRNAGFAWYQIVGLGGGSIRQFNGNKRLTYRVRAVRAF